MTLTWLVLPAYSTDGLEQQQQYVQHTLESSFDNVLGPTGPQTPKQTAAMGTANSRRRASSKSRSPRKAVQQPVANADQQQRQGAKVSSQKPPVHCQTAEQPGKPSYKLFAFDTEGTGLLDHDHINP
jgi:hypothetical protein